MNLTLDNLPRSNHQITAFGFASLSHPPAAPKSGDASTVPITETAHPAEAPFWKQPPNIPRSARPSRSNSTSSPSGDTQ